MPTTASKQAPCLSRRQRFIRGLRSGLPIFLGYMPVGAAFGIVAIDIGFTPVQAVACSATALAGAGQFIGLALINSGATALAVIAATTVVNLRYLLFGAALSPHVSRVPAAGQAALAFTLTDETFAVNIDEARRGRADALSMAGVGAIAWTGWVGGTALGVIAADLIGDPAAWGVHFAMPAMFSALLVAQAESRRHVMTGAMAAAVAVALMIALPADWYMLVTPIIVATAATAVFR